MKRLIFQPYPLLQDYVKHIEIIDSNDFQSEGLANQFLPDGLFELGINLGCDDIQYSCAADATITLKNPNTYFFGQGTSSIFILPKGKLKILMVKIYPWAGACFTPFLLGSLTDELSPGKLVFGEKLEVLADKIRASTNVTQQVLFVQQFLLGCLRKHFQKPHPVLKAASIQIFQQAGQINLAPLAKALNTSSRTIQRLFKEAYGISPKQLSQQLRLRMFARLRAQAPRAHFTDLALQCGYFDQAHFNHDFRAVTLTTPSQFFKETPMVAEFLETAKFPAPLHAS